MASFNNRMFSTYDNDNDAYSSKNCASMVGGGWWFYPTSTCGYTWLTGKSDEKLIKARSGGIMFVTANFKEVTLKIRPGFSQP